MKKQNNITIIRLKDTIEEAKIISKEISELKREKGMMEDH